MKVTIITDLLLYFAKFPQREGVLNMFNKGTSSTPGYSDLQQKVRALPTDNILDIKDYVFGANLEAVQQRITQLNGNYLFVDFGEMDFSRDRFSRDVDIMRMAVSVGTRLREFSSDLVEQALAFDRNMELLNMVRNQMLEDQKTHPWLKNISIDHTIVPMTSPQLHSVGWSLIYKREGYQTLTRQKTNRGV